jgi:hypothetical protein
LATISSGRCFFRRLVVIESLLALRAVDLHIRWIRISKAGQIARTLLFFRPISLAPILKRMIDGSKKLRNQYVPYAEFPVAKRDS